MSTHQIYLYRPGILQVTASMEKIDILAVLLWEHQNAHTPLTKQELSLTTKMIEYSDNTAAESLWVTIGQLPTVTEFNKDLNYTQSITNWDWGKFDTDPRDQIQFLKTIVLPNNYLDPASQEYEQDLMEHVVDYEHWGIPTGVPTSATVGVKNGWYPEKATGWQVNTAGYVRLGKTYYLACVMTGSNPSEAYGIRSSTEWPRRSGTSNRAAPNLDRASSSIARRLARRVAVERLFGLDVLSEPGLSAARSTSAWATASLAA